MTVNTQALVSITEANQNFSKVARLVDDFGSAVILENNVPRYVVMQFGEAEKEAEMSDEDILAVSRKIMSKNKAAYEVLAR